MGYQNSVKNKCSPLPFKTSQTALLGIPVQPAIWTNAILKQQM